MMLTPSLFESVFNTSPIGNYLLSPTPEATILAVNDTFLKASSRTREELVGKSLFEAFPMNPDDPADTGESDLRRSFARVIETGKPDSLPAQRYPIRVELPNGEVGYEERFWSAVSTPIFGDDGRIQCISHSTSDVTGQVRSAAALRDSERRFRALVNATADVVYRMSPDWTQIRQLEGRGFIKDTTDPLEFWLDEYIPVEDQELVHNTIREAIEGRKVFELEHRVFRVDGSCGWTLSRAVPMVDASGAIYEWIGAASDITERKEAEEKLKEADRRKDEFLAMLAHELRNPLAPIGAAAELLQLANLNEERVRQTSQIIGRQVLHMSHLIDDLLDVSRVTRGLVKLEKTPLDIRHILMDAVEQVTPLIRARRHHLALHLPPDATTVTGDEKRLVQVMTNILTNAAKYTPEGGMLELRADVQASHVLIAVIDNGIGMAPEMAARAFDLFSQAERTPDRSSGGLGLGLALVKSLVELHGGTVSCESRGIGQGSRFTVCLPRLPVQDGRDSSHGPGSGTQGASDALRVMVVDDNIDAATMLAMLLEAMGHQVLVEERPGRALELARKTLPQVCLLDIGLPDMDGNALAQRLRAQPETAAAVLIAVTGYGQESDRERSFAAGFDHYLVKPIDTKKLYPILAGIKRT
ncbi:PAS domain-containing hybrid sensor histidine kinase/response regulator [Noviherbaspirillum malthae]|uniref:PAS domain-containing hybrid sensor histidine kinase/response regulator n=1 Tax=Noviherbaspirillum malthae TaxID=1260987 RepID=UPI00188F9C50|nr:ATP-binding protein [Noviherbaspirillum malthae]